MKMGPSIATVFFSVALLGNFADAGGLVHTKSPTSAVRRWPCPNIIPRAGWKAAPPKGVEPLKVNPPPYVVIHHTATKGCTNKSSCAALVKSIQNYHMKEKKWQDIGCNFLVGGDGSIFEGRGWGVTGAHAIGYNNRSVGICLLGNFMEEKPSVLQLKYLNKLVGCGVRSRKVQMDYHLIGHREVGATVCPGDNLYQIIEKWSHFDDHPPKQQ